MDKILGMLGLAKKAGKLEVGEEPVAAAARAKDARLLLLASDAAENSYRRLRHFADAGACLYAKIDATKEELGRALGKTQCAMVAITDIGFAESIAKKLAASDEERYGNTAEKLAIKAQRAAERRKEAEQHEKNIRTGKVKPKEKKEEPKKSTAELKEKKTDKTARPLPRKSRPAEKRGEHRRERIKRESAARFAHARPVKKGKGSAKKEKN